MKYRLGMIWGLSALLGLLTFWICRQGPAMVPGTMWLAADAWAWQLYGIMAIVVLLVYALAGWLLVPYLRHRSDWFVLAAGLPLLVLCLSLMAGGAWRAVDWQSLLLAPCLTSLGLLLGRFAAGHSGRHMPCN